MNCADFEILLADYTDGTLDAVRRQELEAHRDACPACAELARDVAGALAFMERVAEPEVPAELLTRIAFEIPTPSPGQGKRTGVLSGIARWFQPVLQPKFAMGMAMTILSFSLLGRFAGIEVRQLRPADLHPVAVWTAFEQRAAGLWERGVKYYEGLKVVYDVQNRLRELREDEEGANKADAQGQQQKTPGAPATPADKKNVSNGKATK